jgi:hypothetical protein
MKKLIVGTLFAGAVTMGALAQGTLYLDNTANTDTSPTATTGGLVFLNNNGVITLDNNSFNVTLLGGASAASLTPIVTLTASQVFAYGSGLFGDLSGNSYTVPGVAGSGIATLEVEAWTGNAASYAAALATPGSAFGAVTFQNPTGGGGTPIATPTDLTGMPALVLNTPEPSTIALGGLGAAALMFFRRRNK